MFKLKIIFVLSLLATGSLPGAFGQQDKTDRELSQISALVDRAGQMYQEGDFKECAKFIKAAQVRIEKLAKGAPAALLEKLQTDYDRVQRAHGMLIEKGQTMPDLKPLQQKTSDNPFGDSPPPKQPGAGSAKKMESSTDASKGAGTAEKLISFKADVQPILKSKCGRCHITRTRGMLNLTNHAEMMKGADGSPIVVAGKPEDSRMIESIEDGDMPQGNITVSKRELETLKQWIAQGAKDDTKDGALKTFR